MTTEILDLILTAGLALGTIGGCALAIYLLPWSDGELDATERLGQQLANGASTLRTAATRRLAVIPTT